MCCLCSNYYNISKIFDKLYILLINLFKKEIYYQTLFGTFVSLFVFASFSSFLISFFSVNIFEELKQHS